MTEVVPLYVCIVKDSLGGLIALESLADVMEHPVQQFVDISSSGKLERIIAIDGDKLIDVTRDFLSSVIYDTDFSRDKEVAELRENLTPKYVDMLDDYLEDQAGPAVCETERTY